jgi:hypothetical protein
MDRTLEAQVRAVVGRRIRGLQLLEAGPGRILRGQAPTYHVKQPALPAVLRTPRRPVLANEIIVARAPDAAGGEVHP